MNIDFKDLQAEIRNILQTRIKDIINDIRNGDFGFVVEKKNGDSATQADFKVGEILTEELATLVPDSIIIEEESFKKSKLEKMGEQKFTWVIDPIDGTQAFRTEGNNEYCVAIALLEDGQPILSTIYAPELEINNAPELLIEARDDLEKVLVNGAPMIGSKKMI